MKKLTSTILGKITLSPFVLAFLLTIVQQTSAETLHQTATLFRHWGGVTGLIVNHEEITVTSNQQGIRSYQRQNSNEFILVDSLYSNNMCKVSDVHGDRILIGNYNDNILGLYKRNANSGFSLIQSFPSMYTYIQPASIDDSLIVICDLDYYPEQDLHLSPTSVMKNQGDSYNLLKSQVLCSHFGSEIVFLDPYFIDLSSNGMSIQRYNERFDTFINNIPIPLRIKRFNNLLAALNDDQVRFYQLQSDPVRFELVTSVLGGGQMWHWTSDTLFVGKKATERSITVQAISLTNPSQPEALWISDEVLGGTRYMSIDNSHFATLYQDTVYLYERTGESGFTQIGEFSDGGTKPQHIASDQLYAYAADGVHGVQLLDLNQEEIPRHVGCLQTEESAHSSMKIGDQLIVLTGSNSLYLERFDLSDIENPIPLEKLHFQNLGTSDNRLFLVNDSTIALVNKSWIHHVMVLINLNNLNSPIITEYEFDAESVFIDGTKAYLQDSSNGCIYTVLDFSTPQDTTMRNIQPFEPPVLFLDMAVYNNRAWFSCTNMESPSPNRIVEVDINNPLDPIVTSTIPTYERQMNFKVVSNSFLVAASNAGTYLLVLSVEESGHPYTTGEGYVDSKVKHCVLDPNHQRILACADSGLLIVDAEGALAVGNYPTNSPHPVSYMITSIYPNPFNAEVRLTYQLEMATHVELSVFNILGRHVATLKSGAQQKGIYTLDWNGKNLNSGSYFLRLKTPQSVDYRHIILLK